MNIHDGGRMWIEQQQLIRHYLGKLKRSNLIAKVSNVADDVGMTPDEFAQTVSENPRTPLTPGKLHALESFIAQRSPEFYTAYLRDFHLNDGITFHAID